jgi:hypothetical protein
MSQGSCRLSQIYRGLYADQAGGRENGPGLWSDPDPTPPWEFRKQRRTN